MLKKTMILLAIAGFIAAPVMAQGRGYGRKVIRGNAPAQGNRSGFDGGIASLLINLPHEFVSVEEEQGLFLMREEEKLARDVYLALYDLWDLPIFNNIAASEQRHMDAVKVILDKYSLPDPVQIDIEGVFADQNLQSLYYQLVQAGSVSLADAIRIGATIEDLDLFDLIRLLESVDNSDIKTLYQNLMKGSRNHLRSFARQLHSYGLSYTAQYLSQEEVDAIIFSSMERGILDENGDSYFGDTGW